MRHVACQKCNEFCGEVRIDLPDDLRRVVDSVTSAVREGRLVVDNGDLSWSDIVECELHCPNCGQKFQLSCETYHGRGGRWGAA
jgi:hypothetical protein